MIKINIGNVYSNIEQPLPPNVSKELKNRLTVELPGAIYAQKYSPWAGKRSFYWEKTQKFLTGNLSIIRNVLEKYFIEYELVDIRKVVSQGKEIPLNCTLRPYQIEAVNEAVKRQRGIILCGTGGGKTNIVSGIVAKLNVKTLIITHKTDLLFQLKDRFEKLLNVPVGIIGNGECLIEAISVGTVQTISRLYNSKVKVSEKDDEMLKEKGDIIRAFVKEAEAIVVDESHHLGADSFFDIMKNAETAYWKIGVTATNFREDNLDILMEGLTASTFTKISASWLIDNNYLVPPTIFLYPVKQERRKKGDPYGLVYSEAVVNNIDRNKLICNLALKAKQAGKSVLVAITQIEHGEVLEKMLQSVDSSAVFVNGQSDQEVRQQILKDLGVGANRIVIATNIFSEGVDAPGLSVIINAAAAASGIHSLQLLGRVLRPFSNKSKAWIIDLQDNGKYLNNHSKERVDIYMTEPRYKLVPVQSIQEVDFNG